ncbi:hypothetical protein K439DRAFT_1621415 [Ramaria rubella]|nr:hypothetical protein K439DRAFT_1621415 [Ramaria rubella]
MPSNMHCTSPNPSIGTAVPEDRDVLLQAMQDNIMVTKEVVASATQAAEKRFNKIDASIADVKKTLQKQSAMLKILSEERQKQMPRWCPPLAGYSIIIRTHWTLIPKGLRTRQVVHPVWAAKDGGVGRQVIEVNSPQEAVGGNL